MIWRVVFIFLNESYGYSITDKFFPQEHNQDEQDNYNLHNNNTNVLGVVLLHKYHNNILQSHLQEYIEELKDVYDFHILPGSVVHLKSKANAQSTQRNTYPLESQTLHFPLLVALERMRPRCM